MTDIDTLLSQARRPEGQVRICLRGDLLSEWAELERKLSESLRDDRLGQANPVTDRMEAIRAEMENAMVTLTFRGLGWKAWADMEAKYPPRTDDTGETVMTDRIGFNADALFAEAIPASLVSPELTAGQLDKLLDTITNGQYDEIVTCIWGLNRSRVSVPFSDLASVVRENSGERSKQPGHGGSPDDGSTGGNPDERLSTATTNTDG